MADNGSQTDRRVYGSTNADPCLMVIFGASGDLARRSLLPSLFELARDGLLPDPFVVLGMARSDWDDDAFRRGMREAVAPDGSEAREVWDSFAEKLHYLAGDFDAHDSFRTLRDRIADLRGGLDLPDNLLFHLATPPAVFARICGRLDEVGLARAGGDGPSGWRRIIVEKPFGEDRASARELHRDLQRVFAERQIYRIDNFLGK